MAPGPRRFLAAAPLHLALWGVVLATPVATAPGALWLFLVGFVGFTLVGFGWHLFPSMSRHRLAGMPAPAGLFLLAELGVLAGFAGLSGALPAAPGTELTVLGSGAWLGTIAWFAGSLFRSARGARASSAPSERPADGAAGRLFLVSWIFGTAAAGAWLAGAILPGPGFGLWLIGVHLFVLGQAALAIFAVSLRILPRSAGADAPAALAKLLGACGVGGALGVPLGLGVVPPSEGAWLLAPGLLEGAAAVLFVVEIAWVRLRARTPRRDQLLFVGSGLALWAGGAVGLGMVATAAYPFVGAHAALNLLGFVGLTVLGMWFSLLAPFQFVSHRWTSRALAVSVVLLLAALAASLLLGTGAAGAILPTVRSACLVALATVWAIGSLPVLYPHPRARAGA